ncbi:ABC1 kinase family protein [Oryzihumus leptocrescens]|uniref:Putative unusual protein kinase regulating ubiquinone biosynthesis (AarF/ABC1/UbiB family) n=1 Tax=Oryzihumus leptocrescens TaxID=297536 RepID=A0A542ZGT8_9MICO|nr:AarF/UbiB family protein [Oryzihumus leptocrescens]TQL59592.1 putative unusual protein kinase regulating ubiquinone biosynthesis (AarF/ABC1/UbiB family) [Oryzihumus leptocrescens]
MTFTLRPQHATRYAALARLLVRYGRSDLVSGVGMDEFLEATEPSEDAAASAEQLARDLEAMGPTWVKLGQLLSTRVDLLPEPWTDALSRLQDDVEPIPFEDVERVVTEELGVSLRHGFASFDRTPLAAASLGQVHRAELPSGRQVVVKVQRPGVRQVVRDDMAALTELAELADAHTELGRRYGFTQLLEQFRRSLAGELDYQREAANLTRMAELTAPFPHLLVPAPVPDYTTRSVLTMDFVPGRKVTALGPLGRLDLDGRVLVEELFRAYLQMILVDGFLHADPHPGNVLLTPDHRLALIDLGMVATVPARVQGQLVKLLLAISDGNGDDAAAVLASMGHRGEGFDASAFGEQVAELVSRTVALGSDLEAGAVLVELSRLSGTHGLRPPAEMAMVGKALLNLDQVTQHLDPDFAPAETIRANTAEILRSGMKPSLGGAMAAAIEAREFATQLPARANRVMDALAEGSFTVKVEAIDEVQFLHVMQRLANRVTAGVIVAAMVVGAALMMLVPTRSRILGYPSIAMICFSLAAIAAAVLLTLILVTDRRIARRSKADR